MPRSASALAAAFAISALTAAAAHGARGETLTDADRAFITSDVQGARYELALAQQAQQASMRPDVKSYAARVVSDHIAYNDELERLAASHEILVPPGLKPDDKAKLDELGGQSGAEYDRAFVAEAVRINAEDKTDSDKEESSTKASDIKAFLRKFAALDDQHESGAKALQK